MIKKLPDKFLSGSFLSKEQINFSLQSELFDVNAGQAHAIVFRQHDLVHLPVNPANAEFSGMR